MIEKNGIHIAKIELIKLLNQNDINENERVDNLLGKDYAITEMNQILPLYGLTLIRNEYLVVIRDSDFGINDEDTNFLERIKKDINVYIKNSNEKALEIIKRKRFNKIALEIIKRKRFNKIIIISDLERDLEGKKFVAEARKILGFQVTVLFVFKNDIFYWDNFPNVLYSNNKNFYEKFIENYNYNRLTFLHFLK